MKYKTTVVFLIFAVMILSTASNVSATHVSKKVSWQVVMISSYPACSLYHYQIAEKYTDITKGYFELYQFENTSYQTECLTESQFQVYSQPDDLDLLIIVYDRNKGRAELNNNELGGLYAHIGEDKNKNHIIIMCDCPNFSYSDPVWILSHELSHFILNYLGYDLDIAEKLIHEVDAKYDYCVEKIYDESCSSAVTKLRSDRYAYSWTVLPPYEDAIGMKHFKKTQIASGDSPNDFFFEKITEWYTKGKISDEEYLKSLNVLVVTDSKDITDRRTSSDNPVIFTEPPKLQKNQNKPQIDHAKKIVSNFYPDSKELEVRLIPDWLKLEASHFIDNKITKDQYLEQVTNFVANKPQKSKLVSIEYGKSLSDQGLYSEAISVFDKMIWQGLEEGRLEQNALEEKISTLMKIGRYDSAFEHIEVLLDIQPDSEFALENKNVLIERYQSSAND